MTVTDAEIVAALSAYDPQFPGTELEDFQQVEDMRRALEAAEKVRQEELRARIRPQLAAQRIQDSEIEVPARPTEDEFSDLPIVDLSAYDPMTAEKVRAEVRPPKSWMELTVGEQGRFARLVGAPIEECALHHAVYVRGWWAHHDSEARRRDSEAPAETQRDAYAGMPMGARQRARLMRAHYPLRDGLGKPLTKNRHDEWVNEAGDTPCPNDGEMTNLTCWKCGWSRVAERTLRAQHRAQIRPEEERDLG